jgi:hypothetical protein
MAWDSGRFARFTDAVVAHAKGQRPGYGFPHVLMPYGERDELRAVDAARALPAQLGNRGLSARCESIAEAVAQAVRRYAGRALASREDYDRLERDLSGPVGVASSVASILAKRWDAARVDVLVLARLGALYPFAHVSATLEALHSAGIRNTLAVLYPGAADGLRLSFLGLVDSTGGYRGEIVT